jgi:hypothetical protein
MLLMRRREVFPVDGGDGGDDAATGARQLVTPLLTVGLPQPAGLEDSPSFATVPLTPMASKASRIGVVELRRCRTDSLPVHESSERSSMPVI